MTKVNYKLTIAFSAINDFIINLQLWHTRRTCRHTVTLAWGRGVRGSCHISHNTWTSGINNFSCTGKFNVSVFAFKYFTAWLCVKWFRTYYTFNFIYVLCFTFDFADFFYISFSSDCNNKTKSNSSIQCNTVRWEIVFYYFPFAVFANIISQWICDFYLL